MVMKIIGIPTVFGDSQLLADYHWHFHAHPMILSVYAADYCLNFENKHTRTHMHAHARMLEREAALYPEWPHRQGGCLAC